MGKNAIGNQPVYIFTQYEYLTVQFGTISAQLNSALTPDQNVEILKSV